MTSKKTIVWLVLGAFILAVLGGGVTFIVLTLQQREVERELRVTRAALDAGDIAKADTQLSAIQERARGTEAWYGQVLAMRLEVDKKKGDYASAEKAANMILDPKRKFSTESQIKAHSFLGQYALDQENPQTADKHFAQVLSLSGGTGEAAAIANLGKLRMEMAANGVTPEMREQLQSLADGQPDGRVKEEIEYVLGQANQSLLFSPHKTEGDVMHEIKKGDSLWKISRQYKVPQEIIMRVNNINNPQALKVGRIIKIPQVEFAIVVDKSNNTLTLQNHGAFFKKYSIRTGTTNSQTPAGTFRVQAKREIKPGKDGEDGESKDLGARWIGLQGSGVGIHGGADPAKLGTYSPTGSIAMTDEDVQELYDLVPAGAPVKIIGQQPSKGQKS